MKNKIWFKGSIIDEDDATINILSPTSQFGLNVFEGVRGYYNNDTESLFIFRFDDHIKRLFNSCKVISIKCPYSKNDIWNSLKSLIKEANLNGDIAVRITLFVDGNGSWSSLDQADMFISPILKPRKDILTIYGSSACISSWTRISDNSLPPRVKSGANYIAGRYAHLEANRAGYDLPIFLNERGSVSEGAGACIFIIKDNILITPPLYASILESITRDAIKKFCSHINLDFCEREITRTELYIADEIFLCGSAAEITPITSVDGIEISNGNVGNITKTILQTYLDIASNKSKITEFSDWLRKI